MTEDLRSAFPALRDYHETSPREKRYNCIAWAAGDDTQFWWPDPYADRYWPAGVPRETSVAAFMAAFRTLGYEPCTDGSLDDGFQKVAIYASPFRVEHMARQLPTGRWTSKLGRAQDIEHATPAELAEGIYGTVVQYMRRPLGPA